MNKVSFFAAAAAVTALVATPALAQDTAKPRSAMQGKADKAKQIQPMKHSSKQTKHMRHHARVQSRDGAYMRSAAQDNRGDWNNQGWDNRGGFWPGAVAAGAVGTAGAVAATAVGTAGAIATAPFGGPYYRDSYAYGPGYVDTYNYNGVAMPQSPNYAARNGFACQPGTFIKGTRNICQ